MCTSNWTHGSFNGPGLKGPGYTCTAYGCDGTLEPGCGVDKPGCAVVLLVGALVAGLLGLGGYVTVDQAVAATTSEVR